MMPFTLRLVKNSLTFSLCDNNKLFVSFVKVTAAKTAVTRQQQRDANDRTTRQQQQQQQQHNLYVLTLKYAR
jgi:hypothetical protein